MKRRKMLSSGSGAFLGAPCCKGDGANNSSCDDSVFDADIVDGSCEDELMMAMPVEDPRLLISRY